MSKVKQDIHLAWQKKTWKCSVKAHWANVRFEDKICGTDVLNTLIRFNFRCVYCDRQVDPKTWQMDHFYPRALGGKNHISNLAPACKWCNQMKNALDGFAFIKRCREISEKNIIEQKFGELYPNQNKTI